MRQKTERAVTPEGKMAGTQKTSERLDVNHVLNGIAAAQVAAEQRGEHVAVGKRRLCRATPAQVTVDDQADAAAVKLPENRNK